VSKEDWIDSGPESDSGVKSRPLNPQGENTGAGAAEHEKEEAL